MNKDILHFVQVPFTGLGLWNGYRGDEWFRYRIKLFKKYTLNSLLNQTDKNFILWLAFREEERSNEDCQRLYRHLKEVCPFPVIFTYGGLMFWDDKYLNDDLLGRLKTVLPTLKEVVGNKKWIYVTIQPSDDLYHLKAIEEINAQQPADRKALLHDKGFMYNELTKQLAEWLPSTNPPFYTLIYPVETFLDPVKHYEYVKDIKTHEEIPDIFDCTKLSDYKYCVIVHKQNISTSWLHRFRGKILSNRKGRNILKEFGVDNNPKVALKKYKKYN